MHLEYLNLDCLTGVGFDKSDAIMNLINDGFLLCTMAQNPDVMGEEGVKAAPFRLFIVLRKWS
ncbi:MAG: hypothetical protein HFG51_11700 [Lachnospiraceae bacterium]|nr:hypothetical protein [Lachnospiraceae bacterium]